MSTIGTNHDSIKVDFSFQTAEIRLRQVRCAAGPSTLIILAAAIGMDFLQRRLDEFTIRHNPRERDAIEIIPLTIASGAGQRLRCKRPNDLCRLGSGTQST